MNNQRAIRTLLWAMVVILSLVACGPPSPTHTSPTLEPLEGTTATADPSPYVSPTLAVLHTATPTATPIPTPTPTPTPTSTPTPTLTPTPICSETHGRLETGSYFSQILGRDMVYKIYLPPCYDIYTSHSYPTLYLLHGHPLDENHWDDLGADETADGGITSGAYPPFIIVMPNCDPSPDGIFVNTSGGDSSVEGLIVNELLPHIDATYRTWANRQGRAIGGISRGGVWSLEIAFRHPDLFSAVGAHSPALSVNYPHPLYDPFNLLTEPGVRQIRIYLDAGDADWARDGTERLHRALEEQGLPHEFTVGEGSHIDDYWARMLPAYLAFYSLAWPMVEE